MTLRKKLALGALAVVFVLINIDGIARRFRKRTHFEVASVPQLGYPRCADSPEAGVSRVVLVDTVLVGQEGTVNAGAWERFTLEARDCHRVARVHVESSGMIVDAEVVMHPSMEPIRAWRRIGRWGPQGLRYDTRAYDFRTPFVTVTRVDPAGVRSFEELRPRSKPTLVLLPGEAALTLWTQLQPMAVGERVQRMVLDLRKPLERTWVSMLRREAATGAPSPEVYSLDEGSVFADDDHRVTGTLSGMRERVGVGEPARAEGQAPVDPARPL
ncbi:MAG: hypothetical protein Q8Q09_15950 [Deltaproteobacteria bacterium]|nr:hypothetical protein [Deltaproteobacteria bacterium]